MSKPNWTDAQIDAFTRTGSSLLVSAAAGSGKTKTLTERIIRSLTERGGDLSRMLIVTFTRAAAAKLRDEIAAALDEKVPEMPMLEDQILQLESAKICTIDSFCLDLLRANFDKAELPAKFRLMDESEVKVMRRKVMDELISDCYDQEQEWDSVAPGSPIDFPSFVNAFLAGRDDASFLELCLTLDAQLASLADGLSEWEICASILEQTGAENFLSEENPYGNVILAECRDLIDHYTNQFAYYEKQIGNTGGEKAYAAFQAVYADHSAFLDRLRLALGTGYRTVQAVFATFEKNRMKPVPSDQKSDIYIRFTDMRKAFCGAVESLRDRYFSRTAEELVSDCRATAGLCRAAGAFLGAFQKRYSNAKRRAECADFGDVEKLAYRLLVGPDGLPTETAHAVASRFDEIYIDEYQDVNAVQDGIFRAVSNGTNRFMVGDIKQSIYRFRGADSDIFANYRASYGDPGCPDGDVIHMNMNFRSSQTILGFCNAVFNQLWGVAGDSIGYREDDDQLVCGRPADTPVPVRVVLINTKPEAADTVPETPDTESVIGNAGSDTPASEQSNAEAEASWVASEIDRLLREERKADGSKIMPSDIAILVRSDTRTFTKALEPELTARRIAFDNSAGKELFENAEVLLMLCLLSAIDNPQKDSYLLGTMMSPLFAFTLDDVIRIRGNERNTPLYDSLRRYAAEHDDEQVSRFLRDLAQYREMSEGTPCDRLIWQLYRDRGLLALISSEAPTHRARQQRRRNLLALYDYAREFESHGYRGLYSFIRYLRGLIDTDTPLKAPPAAGTLDAVKIMTVHSSKGLEFPVCFLCGCGKRYNEQDARGGLLFDRHVGFGMKLRVPGHFAFADTPLRAVVSSRIRESSREEELRILYVAMTRPQERLYLVCADKQFDTHLQMAEPASDILDRSMVLGANCSMDLILAACSASGILGDVLLCPSQSEHRHAETENPDAETDCGPEPAPDAETVRAYLDLFEQRLDYQYPFASQSKLPSKLAVTKLHPAVLDEDDYSQPDILISEEPVSFSMRERPSFLEGTIPLTAAEAGTATHAFLQFCDFEKLAETGPAAECERLIQSGFLTREMGNAVRLDEIDRFRQSALFTALRHAKSLYREKRFVLPLPAIYFTRDETRSGELSRQNLLVQGAIDCFFYTESGELWLVDYKTDRLSPEERSDRALAVAKLKERHSAQMSYYRLALEKMTGSPPAHTVIYSLHFGDALEIEN